MNAQEARKIIEDMNSRNEIGLIALNAARHWPLVSVNANQENIEVTDMAGKSRVVMGQLSLISDDGKPLIEREKIDFKTAIPRHLLTKVSVTDAMETAANRVGRAMGDKFASVCSRCPNFKIESRVNEEFASDRIVIYVRGGCSALGNDCRNQIPRIWEMHGGEVNQGRRFNPDGSILWENGWSGPTSKVPDPIKTKPAISAREQYEMERQLEMLQNERLGTF
ncbi:hypothetical protein [Methylobacillus sp.]|uniref:hypothetical protein n=1 Tax=Methylobacillus sp. TaxID=56818 RepID=UPI0012CA5AAA|nr:hypothetical protein [Methylobacillus sp.]MPS48484.1 hypothetical protein [Methylobacillus sp.]